MIEEVGESSESYWNTDPIAVFDVGLNNLDLAQEDSWILDFGCSKHTLVEKLVLNDLSKKTINVHNDRIKVIVDINSINVNIYNFLGQVI